jgi:hypothetical protein
MELNKKSLTILAKKVAKNRLSKSTDLRAFRAGTYGCVVVSKSFKYGVEDIENLKKWIKIENMQKSFPICALYFVRLFLK